MIRIMKSEKVKQPKADVRTVVGTILFLVLLGAAVVFIAFAGHV